MGVLRHEAHQRPAPTPVRFVPQHTLWMPVERLRGSGSGEGRRKNNRSTAMDTTLVDIGVNLASERFDKDRDEVLARARDAGIGHCVITGTSAQGSHDAVMLCERYGEQFPGMLSCTVGVHPHEAGNHTPETSRQLRALAIEHPQWVKAIGETGLDFNRNFSTPVAQEKAFEAQLELASELGLP